MNAKTAEEMLREIRRRVEEGSGDHFTVDQLEELVITIAYQRDKLRDELERIKANG
jgi:hypothetical protein